MGSTNNKNDLVEYAFTDEEKQLCIQDLVQQYNNFQIATRLAQQCVGPLSVIPLSEITTDKLREALKEFPRGESVGLTYWKQKLGLPIY